MDATPIRLGQEFGGYATQVLKGSKRVAAIVPELEELALGGTAVLIPLHTLGAWLFAAFLILHIYLTTTGPTPLSNLRAMITGWETLKDDAPGAEQKAG